jgi:hypothetical protein
MSSAADKLAKFRDLIATAESPWLGPQTRAGIRAIAELERSLAEFFSHEQIDQGVQPLLRSAALLWHDHLDASHTISQNIETRDGSWLHGIMHRREPDFGNAKYWFRRVGHHEAFPALAERVAQLLQRDERELTERLSGNGEWRPFSFVDECERAEQGNAQSVNTLRQIQAIEFNVLLEHIFAQG